MDPFGARPSVSVPLFSERGRMFFRSEGAFMNLCAAIDDALLVHENTRVLLCNSAFRKLFGCTSDPCGDLRDRHITEYIHPSYHSLFIEKILKHQAPPETVYTVFGRREDDGTEIELEVRPVRLDYFTALLFKTPNASHQGHQDNPVILSDNPSGRVVSTSDIDTMLSLVMNFEEPLAGLNSLSSRLSSSSMSRQYGSMGTSGQSSDSDDSSSSFVKRNSGSFLSNVFNFTRDIRKISQTVDSTNSFWNSNSSSLATLARRSMCVEQVDHVARLRHHSQALSNLVSDLALMLRLMSGRIRLESNDFEIVRIVESAVSSRAYDGFKIGQEMICAIDESIPHQLVGDRYLLRSVIRYLMTPTETTSHEVPELVLSVSTKSSPTDMVVNGSNGKTIGSKRSLTGTEKESESAVPVGNQKIFIDFVLSGVSSPVVKAVEEFDVSKSLDLDPEELDLDRNANRASIMPLVTKAERFSQEGPVPQCVAFSIAEKIVHHMGGTFGVERALGAKTYSIRFTLPFLTPAPENMSLPPVLHQFVQCNVLIVSSSQVLGRVAKEYLQRLNAQCTIISVENLPEFLANREEERKKRFATVNESMLIDEDLRFDMTYDTGIHAILADVRPNSREHLHMVQQLTRSSLWHVPRVLMTADLRFSDRKSRRAGFAGLLLKPLSVSGLYSVLSAFYRVRPMTLWVNGQTSTAGAIMQPATATADPLAMDTEPFKNESISQVLKTQEEKKEGGKEEQVETATPSRKRRRVGGSTDATQEGVDEEGEETGKGGDSISKEVEEQASEGGQSKKAEAQSRYTILVVEDNPVNRKVLRGCLERLRMKVVMANDGREAVELFKREGEQYSLILMDSLMPTMDGFTATEQIRAIERGYREAGMVRAEIPIIAVTGIGKGENPLLNAQEHCLSAGMNDFLPKPIRMMDLREKLYRWLDVSSNPSSFLPVKTAKPLFDLCLTATVRQLMILPNLPIRFTDTLAQHLLDKADEYGMPLTPHFLRLFGRFKIRRLRFRPSPPWLADAYMKAVLEQRDGYWAKSLRELNVSQCSYLSNAALPYIAKCKKLETLLMVDCRLITNEGVQHLAKLKHVKQFDIGGCDLIKESILQNFRPSRLSGSN